MTCDVCGRKTRAHNTYGVCSATPECRSERERRRHQRHRRATSERGRRWRQSNPDKQHAKSSRWDRAHVDRKREHGRRWNRSNQEKRREGKLMSRYGLSAQDYERMLRAQSGACLICRAASRLVVDHDHNTGEVRGLLCANCNAALGMMQDDPAVLRSAAEYLEGR